MIEVNIKNKDDFFLNEAIKTLRTNIGFCGEDIKTIAITSTLPNEGKSKISLDLALSFAELGGKTLLIDADNRNSVLQGRLCIQDDLPGLTNLLINKDYSLSSVINATNIHDFYMLLAGPAAPNPTELLSGKNFLALMEVLKKNFDYIIIDCPPIGPVIDAAIIAKECDGVLLVIEQGRIKKRYVKKAKDQLSMSGAKILGAVLNKTKTGSSEYGYGKKYGYGYGYGNSRHVQRAKN